MKNFLMRWVGEHDERTTKDGIYVIIRREKINNRYAYVFKNNLGEIDRAMSYLFRRVR